MYAIRYESKERENGEYLKSSRVWDYDGNCTDEILPGTCCLELTQDKYTGEQYKNILPHKYLVAGNYITDGNDDGEVILADCRIIADLNENPNAIDEF